MGENFKEILYQFLTENNLSQSCFAKTIGVKPSQVSEWLKGKASPGYELLKRISLAYNIPADYFLGITDEY